MIVATAVQANAKSSAWNHILKFRRRGRDGRSRKLLSLYHTHGGALRSPCMPCEIMDGWQWSELEQNYGVSYGKFER